jgi:NifU-like protein involved in Fe-S cluster formation
MSELDALYQELILEHYKHPRNKVTLEGSFITHENPSCGDSLRLKIEWDQADPVRRPWLCHKHCFCLHHDRTPFR